MAGQGRRKLCPPVLRAACLCGLAQIVFVENTADDPARRKPDITKAQTVLGWSPQVRRGGGEWQGGVGQCAARFQICRGTEGVRVWRGREGKGGRARRAVLCCLCLGCSGGWAGCAGAGWRLMCCAR